MITRSQVLAGPDVEVLPGYRSGTAPTFEGKYLSVTTYRRDGTPVATPVWFVEESGRLLVETDADSGKVKRIRRTPKVMIAPCTARGRSRRPPTPGHAELLSERSRRHVEGLFARKYRVDLVFIKPIRAIQSALRRGRPQSSSVIVAITPEGVH